MHRRAGYSLIEAAITLAIVSILLLTALMSFQDWGDVEATRGASRSLAAAIDYARSEAIRTGNNHLLFVGTDLSGTALVDEAGDPVPILVLNDGRPGSADQNCAIDAGEPVQGIRLQDNVSFGVSAATAKVPSDDGAGIFLTGSTFVDTLGLPSTTVLFRPDGVPRAINAACAIGALGSGAGGYYFGNAEREAAVVLSALGASRVHSWEANAGAWK